MDVSFATPDLPGLDEVRADALVAFYFAGSDPLRGVLGAADWRLGGWLYRRLEEERTNPISAGSTPWLVGVAGKLPVPRMMLMGLGAAGAFSDAGFREAVGVTSEAARVAGLRRLALELPGRAHDLVSPTRALEWLFRVPAAARFLDNMVLLDDLSAQQDIQAQIQSLRARERRRSQAPPA